MSSSVDTAVSHLVLSQPGIHWAALVDEEGELVAYFPPESRADAAVAGAVLRVAFAPEFARSRGRVSLSAELGTWHAYPMSDDYLFVVACGADVEPPTEATFAAILLETALQPNTWAPAEKKELTD